MIKNLQKKIVYNHLFWSDVVTILVLDDTNRSPNRKSYTISKLNRTHSGLYRCSAKNTVGRSTEEIDLTVQRKFHVIVFSETKRIEIICEMWCNVMNKFVQCVKSFFYPLKDNELLVPNSLSTRQHTRFFVVRLLPGPRIFHKNNGEKSVKIKNTPLFLCLINGGRV